VHLAGMTTRIASAALAALLLAACGSDDADDPTTLAEAIGLPTEEDFQEREREVQAAIRDCMVDEGFEYIPIDPSTMNIQIATPGDRPPAEFTETYGYGVTTMLGERLADGEIAGGGGGVGIATSSDGQDDPNSAIREALSEADREAYDKALHGELREGQDGEVSVAIGPGGEVRSGEEDGPTFSLDDAGCFGQAQEEVGQPLSDPEIGGELRELEERIETDGRTVDAIEAWSACMGDAGYDYASPRDIREALESRLDALRGPDDENGKPTVDEAALALLQEEELATARADEDCWEEHLKDVQADVRAEYEQEFLGDHPDLGSEG
jgi:hypothetical protein